MLKMQQLKRSLKNSFGQVFSMWHGGQAKLKVWAERSQTNAINERVRVCVFQSGQCSAAVLD